MKILIIIVIIVLVVIGIFLMLDGTFIEREYASVFDEDYIHSLSTDIEQISALAMTAGSSHNMQPWKISIDSDTTVQLYADMAKTLPVIDMDNTQMLISLGAYIGAFEHYAHTYGYELSILLQDADMSDELPHIATLTIGEVASGISVDAVSTSTMSYDMDSDTPSDIHIVVDEVIDGYDTLDYTIVESGSSFDDLQALLLEATTIESHHENATRELLDIFRWTERAKNTTKYGLTLTSIPPAMRPFIQPIMRMTSDDWQSFGNSSIGLFQKRLEKEIAYIVITSPAPSTHDYIYCGMAMQDMGYGLSGYAPRPAIQLLQDIDGMEQVYGTFAEDYCDGSESIMILGIQEVSGGTASYNPRHTLAEILVESR